MTVNNKKLLFLDPAYVKSSVGVELSVIPPQSKRIVLHNDKPWESRFISFYSSCIYDGGKYRLYYSLRDNKGRGGMAYAESDDGYNFVKPSLGIVEYDGSYDNNLLGIPQLECTIFIDQTASEDERYKCLAHNTYVGILCHTSADGIHWKLSEDPILPYWCDTQNSVFYDERLGKYVSYLRGWDMTADGSSVRTVKYCTHDSLAGPHCKAAGYRHNISKEYPTVFACDDRDGADIDIYTMAADPLPGCEGYYGAFPTLYRHFPSNINVSKDIDNDGDIETYFSGSIDGIHWHRYDRTPYIPNNMLSDYPTHMTFAGTGIIHTDGKFRKYGTLLRTSHAQTDERDRNPDGAIVCLESREYGYVAAVFDDMGELTTVPWRCIGDSMTVNAEVASDGYLRVGLMYEDGTDIVGFTESDCEPVTGDGTAIVLKWRGGELSQLRGKDVCLHIVGKSCKVFGFDFIDKE